MKRGVIKLLALLLAVYAAWSLGNLAAALAEEGQRAALLDEATRQVEEETARRESALAAFRDDQLFSEFARQLGFISKGDIVFFDGG